VKLHFSADIRDSVAALSNAGNLAYQFLHFFQHFKNVYRNAVCTTRWYTLFVAMLKLARVFIEKKQTVFEHFRLGMFAFGRAIQSEFFKEDKNPFLNYQSIPNWVQSSHDYEHPYQNDTKQLLDTLIFENPRCSDLAHNVLPDQNQPQVWNNCSEFNGSFLFCEEKRNALAKFEVCVTNSSCPSDSNSLHTQLSSEQLPSVPSAFSAGATVPCLIPHHSTAVDSPQVCTRQQTTNLFCKFGVR
jgi:hypothetical protein